METKEAKSFGIIPIFKDGNTLKTIIVKNKSGDHWGLPKGTPEGEEAPLETAKRETTEETGIENFKIEDGKTFEEKYTFEARGNVYNKINTYFLGIVDEMSEIKFADDIADVKWVSFDEAKNILTHQTAIDVISEVENYLK